MTSLEEEAMFTKTYMNKSCQSKIIFRNHDNWLLHYWLTMFYQPGGKALASFQRIHYLIFFLFTFLSATWRREMYQISTQDYSSPPILIESILLRHMFRLFKIFPQINIGIDNILLSFKAFLYVWLCPF